MSTSLPTSGAVFGDFINVTKLDTFERETSLRTGIVRDPKGVQTGNVWLSAITIAASAFIFITIVGWFAVLQAYLDVKIANPTAGNSAKSRLVFAVLATIFSILFLFIFYMIYISITTPK